MILIHHFLLNINFWASKLKIHLPKQTFSLVSGSHAADLSGPVPLATCLNTVEMFCQIMHPSLISDVKLVSAIGIEKKL